MPEAHVERRRPHHFASCRVCYLEEEHAHRAAQPVAVVESVCGAPSSAGAVWMSHPAVSHLRVFVCGAPASCVAVAECSAGLCGCRQRIVCAAAVVLACEYRGRCFGDAGGSVCLPVVRHAGYDDVAGRGGLVTSRICV